MAGRVTCQWMACVLVLAVCGWHGTTADSCFAAESLSDAMDTAEDFPDMNRVKAHAEAGHAKSQTQLADYFLVEGELTNAVFWYRRAARQGDVPAQLSLAGCLLVGRGTAKNPAEAAQLLRRAADGIESSATNRLPRPAAVSALPPVAARETALSTRLPGEPVSSARSAVQETHRDASMPRQILATPTNHAHVERVNSLLVAEPVLQETRPVLRPPSDPRPFP